MRRFLYLFSLAAVLTACGNDNSDAIFNGKIHPVDDSRTVSRNVVSKSVVLHGDNTGMIAVYDSLLICWDPKYKDYFVDVFNVDTGREIGYFCKRGQGDREASSVGTVIQLFKRNGDLMTLLHAFAESKLFFWNISESVRMGETVYDTIVPYKTTPIFFPFYVGEDTLLAYKRNSEHNTQHQAMAPYYEKRTVTTNRLLEELPIYKEKVLKNDNLSEEAFDLSRLLYTWDYLKPDGSKIVQVMQFLPQLNIIDVRSGQVTAYRLKEKPDYSSIFQKNMEDATIFYNHVCADDRYIYATYWGKEPWNDRLGVTLPTFNTIHIFSWQGELLYNLKTDRSFYRVWNDPVRHRLYTIDLNTDEVRYLDLKELGL